MVLSIRQDKLEASVGRNGADTHCRAVYLCELVSVKVAKLIS